ncbi:MAG TPA: hypothetical protein VKB92_08280 [Myxococcales bacterium]|nr:hypothetical protein [Myxococcales bacterium]
MFHVEPTVRALVLGAFLSAAALGQTGTGQSPAGGSSAQAGTGSGTSKKTKKGGATAKPVKRDPRTIGLGRSCTKRTECSSKAQICMRQRDQRGKVFGRGVCALPCASLEAGLTKTRPGFPAKDPQTTERILKKPPPPRCPPPYKCRSKGGDIPVDLCVRE